MGTLLYCSESLLPAFITNEDINDNDTNKSFYVINGEWDGTFNNGSVTIHNPFDKDKIADSKFKCYHFEYDKNISHQTRFIEFEKLVSDGIIK